MSKVMCEICGTLFPENANRCPICGWSPTDTEEENVDSRQEAFEFEDDSQNGSRQDLKGFGHKSWNNGGHEEPEGKNFRTPVVIALVVIIIVLLGAAVVLYFGVLKSGDSEETTAATTAAIAETEPVVTETPTVPCTSLVLTSGKCELKGEGQNFLLHVQVLPENATDTVQYVSNDETVATVTESGRVTAVGEGETSINIICGSQMIRANVSVHYEPEESSVTAPPEETVEGETTESSESTEATAAEGESTAETTVPAETKEVDSSKTLKLKYTDRKFDGAKVGQYFTLELDCDIDPADIEWSSTNPAVATVKNGRVTACSNGITKIIAKYGDQEVECVVRCNNLK